MSTSTVRNKLSQLDLGNLAAIGPRLMAASITQAGQVVRFGSNLLSAALSAMPATARGTGCCNIPETDCPPRCVCEIEWRASAGENLKASIRVTNSSKQQTRLFQFSAVPFSGPGNPQAPLTLSPTDATLAPGQSTVISVDFTPTPAFQPGQTYEAEVLIRGAYEQAVCIVFIPEGASYAQCSVEQGDPPVSLRAHQWYDHFQCVEPCNQPGGRKPAPDFHDH
jgi:hypothetical protein